MLAMANVANLGPVIHSMGSGLRTSYPHEQASTQYDFAAKHNRLHAILHVRLLRWRARQQERGLLLAFSNNDAQDKAASLRLGTGDRQGDPPAAQRFT